MHIDTAATAPRFQCEAAIRFAHCDPAGIVFFPQYLVLFNGLVEDWFNQALGVPYGHLIGPRQIGLPIVRLECDFKAISRMGDKVSLGLQLQRLGSRSLRLCLDCRGHDGGLRVQALKVLVFTDLRTHAACLIPSDVQAAIQRWQDPAAHGPALPPLPADS